MLRPRAKRALSRRLLVQVDEIYRRMTRDLFGCTRETVVRAPDRALSR